MNLGYETKRVAGVEPKPSQVHDAPPAHDRAGEGTAPDRRPVAPVNTGLIPDGTTSPVPPAEGATMNVGMEPVSKLPAEVSPRTGLVSIPTLWPRSPHDPADAFCEHFFRCFFCRVGDRLINDYFCRDGRDLMVAMLDDRFERWSHAE